jgi:RNA polymerase-associated protein CTR9
MYAAALSKFFNNKDAKILLWLARAQYDRKQVRAAKQTLLKAMHICPWDFSLLFNAALTMQQYASSVRATPLGDSEFRVYRFSY